MPYIDTVIVKFVPHRPGSFTYMPGSKNYLLFKVAEKNPTNVILYKFYKTL